MSVLPEHGEIVDSIILDGIGTARSHFFTNPANTIMPEHFKDYWICTKYNKRYICVTLHHYFILKYNIKNAIIAITCVLFIFGLWMQIGH